MDREAATQQMKTLYGKAKAARAEGKRESAKSFRAGGNRIARKLRASVSPSSKDSGDAEE